MTKIPRLDECLYAVSKFCQQDNAEWLINQGANIEFALSGAADGGNLKMIEWTIDQGGKHIEAAYYTAKAHKQHHAAHFLKERIKEKDPEFAAFLDLKSMSTADKMTQK